MKYYGYYEFPVYKQCAYTRNYTFDGYILAQPLQGLQFEEQLCTRAYLERMQRIWTRATIINDRQHSNDCDPECTCNTCSQHNGFFRFLACTDLYHDNRLIWNFAETQDQNLSLIHI